MKISLGWLGSILGNIELETKKVAEGLTSRGIEVERIEDLGANFDKVIIGEILTMDKHPNADRLSLLSVNVGKENLGIVCGAKNMKPGDKIALATIGAKLPNGIEIKKSAIRGVESNGMCCSQVELGLAQQSDGIMILDNKLVNGTPFAKAMGLDDAVIEISVAPNRGDLLGHIGVARELLPIFNISKNCIEKNTEYKNFAKGSNGLKVTINDNRCCRYIGCYIKGVHIKESPEWVKKRLEAVGLRPINNLVDITNYIMLETGHPLHAFDAKEVKDSHIIVRKAANGEQIKLLDGKVVTLSDAEIMIADSQKSLALAGIMGGDHSGIADDTKDIILECAYFEPSSVRRSSKKLFVSSDSSYRFERGVDFNAMNDVVSKTLSMIAELAQPERIFEPVDVVVNRLNKEVIKVDVARLNKFLGINISGNDITKLLSPLGFINEVKDSSCYVTVPGFRNDINIEADVIEEIARTYGYDKIPAELPEIKYSLDSLPATIADKVGLIDRIKDVLSNQGYNECISYSFVPQDYHKLLGYREDEVVALLNPIVETMKVMRVSLVPSMLQTIQFNFNHRNMDLKLFEIGRTYLSKGAAYERPTPNDTVAKESDYLCFASTGSVTDKPDWNNTSKNENSFYTLKGDLELLLKYLRVQRWEIIRVNDAVSRFLHPSISAIVRVYGKDCGFIGKINPKFSQYFDISDNIFVCELNLTELFNVCNNVNNIQFKDIPKFPTVRRDLSFLISDQVEHANIMTSIRKLKVQILKEFGVFDVFKGKNLPQNTKSMAYYFVFGKEDRTLTDEEVDKTMDTLVDELKKEFSIEIR